MLGPLGLVPLPTRYKIYFGEPMVFEGNGDEEDSYIEGHVRKVEDAIRALLARGLESRDGVFA